MRKRSASPNLIPILILILPAHPRLPHRLPIAWLTPCSHTNLPILSPPLAPHQAQLHLLHPAWPAPGRYYPHAQLQPNSPSGAAAATTALRSSFIYLLLFVWPAAIAGHYAANPALCFRLLPDPLAFGPGPLPFISLPFIYPVCYTT